MTVLVVGAGPTGLTMGCELLRQGIACRVIDSADEPSKKSKALALWPRTLEMFERLGVAETAIERGLALRTGVINSKGRPIGQLSLTAVDSRYRFGLILPQVETEGVLTERLEELGGRVERGVAFTGAIEDDGGLCAELDRNGVAETAMCSWLIGCDGAGSAVRAWSQVPFEGDRRDESFLLADVLVRSSLPTDRAQYFLSRAGMLHMVPLPPKTDAEGLGHFRFTFDVATDDAPWDPPLEPALEAEIARRAPGNIEIVTVRWVSRFGIQRRLVARYRHGQCFLAGDAAHVHSPAGGQGINTGIQDAMNLGWKLALVDRGPAAESVLDSYELERKPVAQGIAREADRATRMGMLRNRLAITVRDAASRTLDRAGVLRRTVVPALAGLDVSYSGSPIVREGSRGARLRHRAPAAGDRAPDPAVGASTRWLGSPLASALREALDAPAHVALLLRGSGGEDLAEREAAAALEAAFAATIRVLRIARDATDDPDVLVDVDGQCHRAFGVSAAGIYLIRPDGHIALKSLPTSPRVVRAYVDELLTGPGVPATAPKRPVEASHV